jgi:anti-sigma regulatory factor (Ser/Thr protein kinase)
MKGHESSMTQADLVVPADASAPSRARELFASVVDGSASPEGLARGQLAVSEVVSNAVRHGSADPAGTIEVLIERTTDLVIVTVVQTGSTRDMPSIAEMPEPWATHGYGLGILDAIAERWGIHLDPPSVWFELSL